MPKIKQQYKHANQSYAVQANKSKDLNVPLSRRYMEGPVARELQFFLIISPIEQQILLLTNDSHFIGVRSELRNKFCFFGCFRSSLLCAGFLQLCQVGDTLCCGARASHCTGFSRCGARALDARVSVTAARGLSRCELKHGLRCSHAC